MPMPTTVKQAQADLEEAAREEIAARSRIKDLEAKYDALVVVMEKSKAHLEQVQAEKDAALEAYVVDETKEDLVADARARYDSFVRSIEHSDELLDAYGRALQATRDALPSLSRGVADAKTKLSRKVKEGMADAVRAKVGDEVMAAYAAASWSFGGTFEGFLLEIFGPLEMDRHQERRKAFAEKYFGSAKPGREAA